MNSKGFQRLENECSPNRNDVVLDQRTTQLGRPTLALLLTHQLLAQRRLRSDHRDLLALPLDLETAVSRPDKIDYTCTVHIQFHQGSQVDGLPGSKIPNRQRSV